MYTIGNGRQCSKNSFAQRRIFIFGALGYFKLGNLLEGLRRLTSYKLALCVVAAFTEQVVPVHKHITLFWIAFVSGKKGATTKLTKIAAVKLSDHPPIPYLLSALCNCTVFKCQELALSKASVLLTTRDNLLHSRWSTGLFVCKIAGNFVVLYLSS